MSDVKQLEEALGYHFTSRSLLETALTHSSYINEHGLTKDQCNERLEFLGDAVLEMISSECLFLKYPHEREGELSRRRAALVCEPGLAASARQVSLGNYLRLGHGAKQEGAASRDSVLSDAFEAVLAAVFLDGGIEEVKKIIYRFVLDPMEDKQENRDVKTILQEMLQKEGKTVSYRMIREEGPDHDKTFFSVCLIDGQEAGYGQGHSKKISEMEAAKDALKKLE